MSLTYWINTIASITLIVFVIVAGLEISNYTVALLVILVALNLGQQLALQTIQSNHQYYNLLDVLNKIDEKVISKKERAELDNIYAKTMDFDAQASMIHSLIVFGVLVVTFFSLF